MRLTAMVPVMALLAGCPSTSNKCFDRSCLSDTSTVTLGADPSGTLDACDASGNCQPVPNPEGCATLVVTIDGTTGAACEKCLDASGGTIYDRCRSTAVQCTVVTAPEPDCVVCAHVDGPVIYSSCVPTTPEGCTTKVDASGATCTVCVDAAGNTTVDTCKDVCGGVTCVMPACPVGTELRRRPNECCDECVPVDDCSATVCPGAIPECPPGTMLERDPTTCCVFACVPISCPPGPSCDASGSCPDGATCVNGSCVAICPDGSIPTPDFPACGACMPPPPKCDSTTPCPTGTHCDATVGGCVPDPPACWVDSDCQAGQHCEGAVKCPAGAVCIVADHPGVCVPNPPPPPPPCDSTTPCPTGTTCSNGVCVAGLCEVTQCGPELGMANWTCQDGSVGGPTGRCLLLADGQCGWEVRWCQ
jgi:hypothetical protein